MLQTRPSKCFFSKTKFLKARCARFLKWLDCQFFFFSFSFSSKKKCQSRSRFDSFFPCSILLMWLYVERKEEKKKRKKDNNFKSERSEPLKILFYKKKQKKKTKKKNQNIKQRYDKKIATSFSNKNTILWSRLDKIHIFFFKRRYKSFVDCSIANFTHLLGYSKCLSIRSGSEKFAKGAAWGNNSCRSEKSAKSLYFGRNVQLTCPRSSFGM